jgi:hypothetical protein
MAEEVQAEVAVAQGTQGGGPGHIFA